MTLSSPHNNRAFTLVELLVSTVVLALLLAMVTQIVNATSITVGHDKQRLDLDSEARLIFDRMASDLSGMVRRPDVDNTAYPYYNNLGNNDTSFWKRAGNDNFYFWSEAPAYSTSGISNASFSTMTATGYRIWEEAATNSVSPLFSLERYANSGIWDTSTGSGNGGTGASGAMFLVFDSSGAAIKESTWAGSITGGFTRKKYFASACHAIGPQTFRLEFCFQMKDGTFSSKVDPKKAFQDVSAIVATIALVDDATRVKFANFPGTIAGVVNKLVDGDESDVAGKWTNTLLTDGSIPPLIAANARVYQRFFYFK